MSEKTNKTVKATEEKPDLVIDATDSAVGRVASFAAKQALLGKTVAVVNCREAVVTGKRNSVILEYRDIRQKGGASLNGPFYPKHPQKIVKRMVRGMLSYKMGRGADALKRVKCYDTVPKEFEALKKPFAHGTVSTKSIKLWDLSREI